MKSLIFLDITPCNPLVVNRRFGGTCRLHLQGRRLSPAGDQHEPGSSALSVDFQRTTSTRRYIPELELFLTSAVRISNLLPEYYD
jgi:hypothetical protein